MINDTYERVYNCIKENNIKQNLIAKESGLSVGFVSMVINGKKPVSNNFLKGLSKITGRSVHYFLFGTEEYENLASLNKLIDTFIESGYINEKGDFDKDIESILLTMLKKEIRDKLRSIEENKKEQ